MANLKLLKIFNSSNRKFQKPVSCIKDEVSNDAYDFKNHTVITTNSFSCLIKFFLHLSFSIIYYNESCVIKLRAFGSAHVPSGFCGI